MKKPQGSLFIHDLRKRSFLVAVLLFFFFAPYGVKIADMVVHRHYTSHLITTAEAEINIEGHFCPIPGFQYQSFLFEPLVEETSGIHFLHKIFLFNTQDPFVSPYSCSFSLRGPPLLDNLS